MLTFWLLTTIFIGHAQIIAEAKRQLLKAPQGNCYRFSYLKKLSYEEHLIAKANISRCYVRLSNVNLGKSDHDSGTD